MGTGMIWIIFIGIAAVSWLVQMNLQNKFKKYSKIPTGNGMTGADVALKMLHDNGIYDVTVTHTPGHLTDHYNPANKTVNLSESVYSSCSPRMWSRRAACTRIRSVDNAQQTGAGSLFCLTVDDVVAAGRYLAAELLSATVAGGHYTVCIDNFIQLHHLAGGNQCK